MALGTTACAAPDRMVVVAPVTRVDMVLDHATAKVAATHLAQAGICRRLLLANNFR